MKENILKIGRFFLFILFLPLILLFCIGLLIYTPIDFLRYHSSCYYKDTKEKYKFLGAFNSCFQLYNIIKEKDFPIDFYRNPNFNFNAGGYFVFKNNLILPDYDPFFDEKNNTWLTESDGEYIEIMIEEDIESCNKSLGRAVCDHALILIDRNKIPENADTVFDKYRLVPVIKEDIAAALQNIINSIDDGNKIL